MVTAGRWLFQEPPRRVAVLRALKLGDLLCAVPAFRAFRAAWPDAELLLIGLPWARAVAERLPHYLDGFRELPGWPGLPERERQIDRAPAFLAAMRAERLDLVLQLHGSGRVTNPLALLLGGRRTAGFYGPGDFCPDPDWFCPWPESGLEVHRLLRLPEFLGLPVPGDDLEFPLTDDDFRALRAVPGAEALEPGGYACVHPGASVPERRWPPERFAAVADALAGRGLRVVLTGSAGEAGLTRAVAAAMRAPAVDLAGRTGLGPLGALVSGARLLVCNDTGVSHLAAALGVPSVVLATGDHPARWAPADRRRHRVLCRAGGATAAEALAAADGLLAAGEALPRPVLQRSFE